MEEIKSMEEFEDRNYIKMVCDLRGDALYFSIEAISKLSKSRNDSKLKRVCVTPFLRDVPLDYIKMESTPPGDRLVHRHAESSGIWD